MVINNPPKSYHLYFTDKTIFHKIFHKNSDKSFGGGKTLNSFSPTVLFYRWRIESIDICIFAQRHLANNRADSNSHYWIQLFLIVSCLLHGHGMKRLLKRMKLLLVISVCVYICLFSKTENVCLGTIVILFYHYD